MRPARGHLVLRRRVSGFAVLQMVSLRGMFNFSFFGFGKRLALANRAGTHISLLLLYRTLVVRFLRALGADLAIHALAAILLLTNYDPKICIKEWRVVTKKPYVISPSHLQSSNKSVLHLLTPALLANKNQPPQTTQPILTNFKNTQKSPKPSYLSISTVSGQSASHRP